MKQIPVISPDLKKSIDKPNNLEDEKKTIATKSNGNIIIILLTFGILIVAYYLKFNNDPNSRNDFNANLDKTIEESRKIGQMTEMLLTY